jgi:sulfur-oxidizing protein SoxY
MNLLRRFAITSFVALALAPAANRVIAQEPESPEWQKVRQALFSDRAFEPDSTNLIELEMPARAEDPAVVPLVIRTRVAQTADRYIAKIYLIVDKNPSPLGAVFALSPDSGRADIETRVRIEEYTHVRAIAETNDGKLYMAQRFVKASGGCSAPAGKDAQAALARLGKMRLRTDGEVRLNEPNQVQLMISHPNHSGLAMDQLTRHYTPAHFVRLIKVTYAGQPIVGAEVDFTISENPNFRFYFVPRAEGELKAEVVDSNDLKFESSIAIRRGAAAASL